MTPSYHQVSPMVRSRSCSTNRGSSYLGGYGYDNRSLVRAQSFTAASSGGFTRPSYGYGGGFMSRSMTRSGSNLFGRSLSASALDRTPPFSNVGVQRSTPHYSDKYPYVRYSYGNTDTALSVKTQTELKNPSVYGIKDTGTKRWLEGKLNAYNTGLFQRPPPSRPERPLAPVRSYVRYMGQDDAVDMYKNKYMTVGTLSKYWLSPTTASSRRDRDLNVSSATASSNYGSYSSRYATRPTYYSKVASRLY
ncbi:unnamed protein product [Bursaphelenchus okinawaensis]|uniref:Uncharacterized protein n=1 Tax=Bursaphelenchus okinawaensis TaxID=465554 RepID=A0A811LP89_9BILA|nr:unnamed protein product [Bursaphelenchus okinawaensis]CAG9125250.1 unnamed protein product [Bursaphelenchus okinawaensis]